MNEYIGWSLLITWLIFLVVIGIITEKRKKNIQSKLIEKFQFKKHNFIKKVENKEYERNIENGSEFLWINKNEGYLTLKIGINFKPTNNYEKLKFFQHLKYSKKFSKKFKNEKYQLFGQRNPIIILELKIQNVNQIPEYKKVEGIFKNMIKILKRENLTKHIEQ